MQNMQSVPQLLAPKAPKSAPKCSDFARFGHFCEKVAQKAGKRDTGQNSPAACAPHVRNLSPCNGGATPALQQYTPAGLRAQKGAILWKSILYIIAPKGQFDMLFAFLTHQNASKCGNFCFFGGSLEICTQRGVRTHLAHGLVPMPRISAQGKKGFSSFWAGGG